MTLETGILLHAGPVSLPEYAARVLLHLLAIATVGAVTWGLSKMAGVVTGTRDGDGPLAGDRR